MNFVSLYNNNIKITTGCDWLKLSGPCGDIVKKKI